MMLYKLVNKVHKVTYPSSFNEYATKFNFDRRLVHVYMMIPTEPDQTLVYNKEGNVILDSGALIYLGNIKESYDAFVTFLDASDLSFASNLDYLKLYWDVILESGFCDGKAAF
ncbi:MAG: hypothetical protein ACRDD8_00320, partial [Bacteroidales bacterium]